jgi:hypothetical protein
MTQWWFFNAFEPIKIAKLTKCQTESQSQKQVQGNMDPQQM